MDIDDKMKMDMLDELECAMDSHDQEAYASSRNPIAGSMDQGMEEIDLAGEGEVIEGAGDALEGAGEIAMDQGIDDALVGGEMAGAGDAIAEDDPLLMRGQFAKRNV